MKVLEEAWRVDDKESSTAVSLGMFFAMLAEQDKGAVLLPKAESFFRSAVALNADNNEAWIRLGEFLQSKQGDLRGADSAFLEAARNYLPLLDGDDITVSSQHIEEASSSSTALNAARAFGLLRQTREQLEFIREALSNCDVPTKFLCPISLEIMLFPVYVDPEGPRYERCSLQLWYESDPDSMLGSLMPASIDDAGQGGLPLRHDPMLSNQIRFFLGMRGIGVG